MGQFSQLERKRKTYIMDLANSQFFKSICFFKLNSFVHQFFSLWIEVILAWEKSIFFWLQLHLPFVTLMLQFLEVLSSLLNLFPKLHGLIASSLKLKLGFLQFHVTLRSDLRVTVRIFFSHSCSLKLLAVNRLELVNLTDHRLSWGCLVIDQAFQVFLLLVFAVDHSVIAVLQAQVTLVQTVEVSHFLTNFECIQFELCNFQVLIIACSSLFASMLTTVVMWGRASVVNLAGRVIFECDPVHMACILIYFHIWHLLNWLKKLIPSREASWGFGVLGFWGFFFSGS